MTQPQIHHHVPHLSEADDIQTAASYTAWLLGFRETCFVTACPIEREDSSDSPQARY